MFVSMSVFTSQVGADGGEKTKGWEQEDTGGGGREGGPAQVARSDECEGKRRSGLKKGRVQTLLGEER